MPNHRVTILGILLFAAYLPSQSVAETSAPKSVRSDAGAANQDNLKARELRDVDVVTLVRRANSFWDEDFNRADATAIALHYTSSPSVMPPGSGPLHNASAISGFYRKLFDNGVSRHSTELISASIVGNSIYETARWKAFGSPAGGNPMFEGNILFVYEMDEQGQLKIATQIWN